MGVVGVMGVIRGHARGSARAGRARHGGRPTWVRRLRNVDLPEVVLFDEKVALGGWAAARFAEDCRDAGARVVLASTRSEEEAAEAAAAIDADATFADQDKVSLLRRALAELRVVPNGFGNAPKEAPRAPAAKWCVLLESDGEGARAARIVGMRCLGVGPTDVAEAHAHVETLEGILAEDIATPGTFWLQPLQPEKPASGTATSADGNDDADDDAELRRILADIAPPS